MKNHLLTHRPTLPVWNPFAPGYAENPHTLLRHLQETNPVHRGINGRWMLLKHADVKQAFSSADFRTISLQQQFKATNQLLLNQGHNLNDLAASVSKWLLFLNPPDHTELRQLIVRIWNQFKVRDYIEEVVEEALYYMGQKKETDLITDYAVFVPTRVISRILGLPQEDYKQLRGWSYGFAQFVEPFSSLHHLVHLNQLAGDFCRYMAAVTVAKREKPDDSFLSKLLEANEALTNPLTHEEIVSVLTLLYFAGVETSIFLFGTGVHALLDHPRQAEQLREDPGCVHAAVEELIRYSTPAQYTTRVPVKDITIRGTEIRAGELVTLATVAANRDPEVFENPNSLDFDRKKNPHISFGHGLHHCVGAKLARDEMQIAMPLFLKRFPNVRLHPDQKPVWEKFITNRGLQTLPVLL